MTTPHHDEARLTPAEVTGAVLGGIAAVIAIVLVVGASDDRSRMSGVLLLLAALSLVLTPFGRRSSAAKVGGMAAGVLAVIAGVTVLIIF